MGELKLLPEDFITNIITDLGSLLVGNMGVIAGILAATAGIGFVLRAFKGARKGVERQGGKL